MKSKKTGTILMVMDERLSREKAAVLTRILHVLRSVFEITLLNGSANEKQLLQKLDEKPYDLILAPWYRYSAWTRIEGFYGLTRTSGPTFAGYFCEALLPYELNESADYLRTILLDFGNTTASEIVLFLRTLIQDRKRSGLLPLIDVTTPVYCQNWYSGQGLGFRMDAVTALPEVANSDWAKRGNPIRILLAALWSLIYEYGPGKSEFAQTLTQNAPKAYFQVAADPKIFLLRLCYSMPSWGPKDVLHAFWPKKDHPSEPAQLLLRHADFIRVHPIMENSDIEVVVGILPSRVAEKAPDQVHTFWIEPLAAHIMLEVPYEVPNPEARHLRLLPQPATTENKPRPLDTAGPARERVIVEAASKIRELKQLIHEREATIRDLRSGGVGTAQALPPPDAEALLHAFQEKFFEARYQIRQFEIQIAELEQRQAKPGEVAALKNRMQALAAQEQAWINQLAKTIESVRLAKKGER